MRFPFYHGEFRSPALQSSGRNGAGFTGSPAASFYTAFVIFAVSRISIT